MSALRQWVFAAAAGLALLGTAAAAPAPVQLVQAPAGDQGLVLRSQPGRSWLVRPNGRRQRLPVRRGETLVELVEFARGWAAAGTRVGSRGSELVVLKDGAAGVQRLPAPPGREAAVRVAPVPMASAASFAGVAWLEGDEPLSYRVRAADWSGAEWTPPAAVSARARGGQAGLVGAVLEDGRWLLVWSASEGHGSELYWSERRKTGWSQPRRVAPANGVPDITPALASGPDGGALLVWARQTVDGYRLMSAAYDGGRWSAPRPLGGLTGAFPRFAVAGGARFVVARAPAGWSVVELDGGGRLVRHVTQAADGRRRPVLSVDDGALGLLWDGPRRRLELGWEARP